MLCGGKLVPVVFAVIYSVPHLRVEGVLRRENGFRAIFFDLDGTLRHNVPSAHDTFFNFAIDLGVNDSIEGRRRAFRWAHYYWAQSKELMADVKVHGQLSDEFWTNYALRYLNAFGHPSEEAARISVDLHQLMVEKYEPQDVIAPETPETLRSLTEAGYQLGLITNRHAPVDDYLRDIQLFDFFEMTLTAGEVGIWKPEKGIFQQALYKLDITPAEAVYIGDNYYADVVGAQAVGMLPILLDPNGYFGDVDCQIIRSLGDIQEAIIQRN